MKEVGRPAGSSELKNSNWFGSGEAKFFELPLSDTNIILLQNLLMTPAKHYIKTENVHIGRLLIHTFLNALNYYRNIGCLTTIDRQSLPSHVLDFMAIKKEKEGLFIESIERYNIENTSVDFVWIELTDQLKTVLTKKELQGFCDLVLANSQTPIVIVSYEDSGIA